jgi:hypothetical protein
VEMILQETVRVGLCNLRRMLPPQFHEIGVIPLLEENVLMVVSTIVDVIEGPEYERRRVGGHDFYYKTKRPDMSSRNRD